MSHVTHLNEPCHTYKWAPSQIWTSHVMDMNATHVNMTEFCHTYECGGPMSHIWMRASAFMLHIWMRGPHVTHMNAGLRIHVTYMNAGPLHYIIPPKKLLGGGFSTPYTRFCLICTINSELTHFPIYECGASTFMSQTWMWGLCI